MTIAQTTFEFQGFHVPEQMAVWTGAGADSFASVAETQIEVLQHYSRIEPDHHVLDVGCGIGRTAIPLTAILCQKGRYCGIDVVHESIGWCQANITSRYPNFAFFHIDARSSLYNPTGEVEPASISLPVADGSIDRIYLFSVFTHMYETEITHYLEEFRRALKPGGLVLTTWFMIDEAALKAIKDGGPTWDWLRFQHRISDGCWVNAIDHPLGAVGYSKPAIERMCDGARLRIANIIPGTWSGLHPNIRQGGQDITVLARDDHCQSAM